MQQIYYVRESHLVGFYNIGQNLVYLVYVEFKIWR